MRKTLQALAAFLLLLAWSCQKEESPLTGQTDNTIAISQVTTPKHAQ